jgi:hypothetical protein
MGTDYKCLRAFIELRAFIWWSINNNWNVQINPLAAPVFQPSLGISQFRVVHTDQDRTLISCLGTNEGWRFPIKHILVMRSFSIARGGRAQPKISWENTYLSISISANSTIDDAPGNPQPVSVSSRVSPPESQGWFGDARAGLRFSLRVRLRMRTL